MRPTGRSFFAGRRFPIEGRPRTPARSAGSSRVKYDAKRPWRDAQGLGETLDKPGFNP
jgi:hypothetical protein